MPKKKSNPAATRRERVGKVTVEESTFPGYQIYADEETLEDLVQEEFGS